MANTPQTLVCSDVATSSTVTTAAEEAISQTSQPVAVLKLRKPRLEKKVEWTNDTVDNENMNKKKSKCCCIFEKKRKIGESDSEDSDNECENCSGHVEKKQQPSDSSQPQPENNIPLTS